MESIFNYTCFIETMWRFHFFPEVWNSLKATEIICFLMALSNSLVIPSGTVTFVGCSPLTIFSISYTKIKLLRFSNCSGVNFGKFGIFLESYLFLSRFSNSYAWILVNFNGSFKVVVSPLSLLTLCNCLPHIFLKPCLDIFHCWVLCTKFSWNM